MLIKIKIFSHCLSHENQDLGHLYYMQTYSNGITSLLEVLFAPLGFSHFYCSVFTHFAHFLQPSRT